MLPTESQAFVFKEDLIPSGFYDSFRKSGGPSENFSSVFRAGGFKEDLRRLAV